MKMINGLVESGVRDVSCPICQRDWIKILNLPSCSLLGSSNSNQLLTNFIFDFAQHFCALSVKSYV